MLYLYTLLRRQLILLQRAEYGAFYPYPIHKPWIPHRHCGHFAGEVQRLLCHPSWQRCGVPEDEPFLLCHFPEAEIPLGHGPAVKRLPGV